MGRTRTTRNGETIPRQLGRRQQAKIIHQAHVPKTGPDVPNAHEGPPVPRVHQTLDDRRLEILREARHLGVYDQLLDFQKEALNRPVTGIQTATEAEACEINLSTIDLGVQRIYSRKRCETARRALLKLITSSGHLASPILANLRFDVVEPTPRLNRAEAYRLRYLHFEGLMARFS